MKSRRLSPMGVTMDHAVAMLIPFAGGLLWAWCGYMWLFLAAALLAFLNLIVALFITDRERCPNGR
ncbi:MAG TPA: hypothetical protein VN441_00340 [Syntrophomonas sp.]|nr:hypothetical protein [Syntrophomonas sp.]